MPEFKIEIQGLDRLNESFKKSPRMVVDNLTQAIKTSINIIRPIMVKNAPVKTSKLRQNISAISSGLVGQVGPNLAVTPYACIFDSRTKIKTKRGHIEISRVKINDEVLTQDGTFHKVLETPKFKAIDKPNLVDLEIEYRKNRIHKLTLTSDHKVLSKINGSICWIEAGKLKKNSIVFSPIKIDNKKGLGKINKKRNCKMCNSIFNGQNDKYCSIKCRDEMYKLNHPQKGLQVNPSMKSFINYDIFKEVKILKVKKWKNINTNKNKKLYDLTVDKIHSFVASGIIISNSYVHQGTRAYMIFPKTKKALYWKGALHPVRKVNHPGIRANPFVERTANEATSPVNQIFNKTLENIAKELSK